MNAPRGELSNQEYHEFMSALDAKGLEVTRQFRDETEVTLVIRRGCVKQSVRVRKVGADCNHVVLVSQATWPWRWKEESRLFWEIFDVANRFLCLESYQIDVFFSKEDGCYIANIPDLRCCSAFGESPTQAVREVIKAKTAWLKAAKKEGKPIPPSRLR